MMDWPADVKRADRTNRRCWRSTAQSIQWLAKRVRLERSVQLVCSKSKTSMAAPIQAQPNESVPGLGEDERVEEQQLWPAVVRPLPPGPSSSAVPCDTNQSQTHRGQAASSPQTPKVFRFFPSRRRPPGSNSSGACSAAGSVGEPLQRTGLKGAADAALSYASVRRRPKCEPVRWHHVRLHRGAAAQGQRGRCDGHSARGAATLLRASRWPRGKSKPTDVFPKKKKDEGDLTKEAKGKQTKSSVCICFLPFHSSPPSPLPFATHTKPLSLCFSVSLVSLLSPLSLYI